MLLMVIVYRLQICKDSFAVNCLHNLLFVMSFDFKESVSLTQRC